MKRTVLIIGLVCCGLATALAQPMSGSYTVGGAAPDFATPQDAASALFQRGVSGPVFINIRPGLYVRNGGNSTVLRLDTLIAGHSSTNRITFQSDASAGGTAENVIFQFNRTNPNDPERFDLVHIRLDYITLRNLTLRDVDSSHTFDNHLIRFEGLFPTNLVVDGFMLEGCKLVGTPHILMPPSALLGTDFGVGLGSHVGETTIRGNTFVRLMRAISSANRGTTLASATVEDNQFLEGYRSASGSGNPLGSAIELDCRNPIVRRNKIDFHNSVNQGFLGIYVTQPDSSIVERNQITGPVSLAMWLRGDPNPPFPGHLIVNNMMTGTLNCEAPNSRILFNTIVLPPVPFQQALWTALRVVRPGCQVLNNLILDFETQDIGFTYDQGNQQSPGLISNFNIFYRFFPPGWRGAFFVRDGGFYSSLPQYQAATGLDTNSIFKAIDLMDVFSNLHLTDCQAADEDLIGIPISGITEDFDGDIRSTTRPLKGADEVAPRAIALWGDAFKIPLAGTPFSIASGRFDNLLVDGLAVPDYDSRQVRLYHNLPSSRSFVHSGTLQTGFKPLSIVFHDFDGDGHLDLIAGGDSSIIRVFWGDGGGGFPAVTDVPFPGSVVVNMVPEPQQTFTNLRTIFVANGQLFGYLINTGGRQLCFDFQRRADGEPDTLGSFINGFVVGDFGGDSTVDIAGISNSTGHFATWEIERVSGTGGLCTPHIFRRRGDYQQSQSGTGWYSYANSIAVGDFDGDSDLDIVTTGFSENRLVLLRNQGNFTFAAETIAVNNARAVVALDYNNDGRLDLVTVNRLLSDNGITLFLNDGTGRFRPEFTCFPTFASGHPFAVVASDFDLDGKMDIAIATHIAPNKDTAFVLYNFGGGITSVGDQPSAHKPTEFRLEQNYPNPFNPTTKIRYTLPSQDGGSAKGRAGVGSHVSLKVYDLLGREVAALVNEVLPPGEYVRQWDASGFASGVYFYRLHAGNFVQTKKLMLLR
jgi:hypothetical protein